MRCYSPGAGNANYRVRAFKNPRHSPAKGVRSPSVSCWRWCRSTGYGSRIGTSAAIRWGLHRAAIPRFWIRLRLAHRGGEYMGRLGQHAVVIGGSMAGLMTARVLSDFFDQVTVL